MHIKLKDSDCCGCPACSCQDLNETFDKRNNLARSYKQDLSAPTALKIDAKRLAGSKVYFGLENTGFTQSPSLPSHMAHSTVISDPPCRGWESAVQKVEIKLTVHVHPRLTPRTTKGHPKAHKRFAKAVLELPFTPRIQNWH
eukprot:6462174-Amphidinium_carterae.1